MSFHTRAAWEARAKRKEAYLKSLRDARVEEAKKEGVERARMERERRMNKFKRRPNEPGIFSAIGMGMSSMFPRPPVRSIRPMKRTHNVKYKTVRVPITRKTHRKRYSKPSNTGFNTSNWGF
jgi:hypothetical protein